ncbi:MAG: NUDIX hydrolase [Proteobacteria bacterium]|nr:NUDIX hydrolase [Pseudomonadota bacterium]
MSGGPLENSISEVPIRDAACLLVADLSGAEPKLLMGRRHADQVFLPNKWVFPGGRVEDDDRHFAKQFAGQFSPADLADEIKPFALAGIRELFEETGLLIGGKGPTPAGLPAWALFATSGYAPTPVNLFPFARAITPPGRVRRYDTWFFLTSSGAISADRFATDDELLDLGWFTLSEAAALDLPNITRLVLNDVTERLEVKHAFCNVAEHLPFYYSAGLSFHRDLISCKVAPPMP